ncbi:MAG: hypothetical protein PHU12_03350 [Candidatus Aenigmarchaeota archaeon]|nr:hypothetical protein [Candidatus Aenigmarchaeota archaeon]
MPDFIPVLVVAIICMLGLMMVFGGFITTTEEPSSSVSEYQETRISLGTNFIVAEYKAGSEFVKLTSNVSSGMFSKKEDSATFDVKKLSELKNGRVYLDVKDTNDYGSLIIEVNGNVVYNNVTPKGIREVKFDKNFMIDEDNVVTVKAGGSGWRIWAPTVYRVETRIFGDIYDSVKKTVDFNLSYIPGKPRLNLFIASKDGTGNLIVKINGFNIAKSKSNVFKDFDSAVLMEGTNYVEFTAESGSRFNIQSAYLTFE